MQRVPRQDNYVNHSIPNINEMLKDAKDAWAGRQALMKSAASTKGQQRGYGQFRSRHVW